MNFSHEKKLDLLNTEKESPIKPGISELSE